MTASKLGRVRLIGNPDDVRALAIIPACTCTIAALPREDVGGCYCCPCGWLQAGDLSGWIKRVDDERAYLGNSG